MRQARRIARSRSPERFQSGNDAGIVKAADRSGAEAEHRCQYLVGVLTKARRGRKCSSCCPDQGRGGASTRIIETAGLGNPLEQWVSGEQPRVGGDCSMN